MGILSGNPKHEPMHYGEVSGAWGSLVAKKGMISYYQVLHNHTGDADLRDFIEQSIDTAREEAAELERVLKENGVPLPPSPPEKPKADLELIPPGARLTDVEVASLVAADTSMGLVACSQVMAMCIREDLAALYLTFYTKKAEMGLRMLRMQKEKGWLVVPPLHVNTAEVQHA
ncbi:DUF3231 family protein [Tumebacillus permanentifrigoris]|uniref:Uncharacterized protein DUF3231 n=1 Tax=Tumebacillus permanentifrigoris TaxID=378543 RepID=A0A316DEF2_9BACL|nr:DUF3231 family protein [Tumebacillus permanentifrigoris]PWK14327.1 uncharacterized protein DUF3231 [Tumebacillus permanentifrigoris]